MARRDSTSASSGWGWGSEGPAAPQRLPRAPTPPKRGTAGAVLAALAFVGVLGAVVAVLVLSRGGEDPDEAVAIEEEDTSSSKDEDGVDPDADADEEGPPKKAPSSLDRIVWTTSGTTTLEQLSQTWSIPRDVLTQLNPELAAGKPIEAETQLVVHEKSLGASISIGPPNDGRLVRGVPLPEGKAWLLPEDRTRAFGTTETVAAVFDALQAYARTFPDAVPIQMGDLSARRGGRIYGHQSHQTGRDVDIRLILSSEGEGFDPERNWFLVKTLVDGGDVRAIFLNRTEQAWLREAAENDVGAEAAERYFELISHEPGHTIHMHVRYACAPEDRRCVGYSMPDTDEQDAKLPLTPGGKGKGGNSKLPGSKGKGSKPVSGKKNRKLSKGKKKKKKGKKKKGKKKKKG